MIDPGILYSAVCLTYCEYLIWRIWKWQPPQPDA